MNALSGDNSSQPADKTTPILQFPVRDHGVQRSGPTVPIKATFPETIGEHDSINAEQAACFTISDICADADAAAVRISVTDRLKNSVSADGVLRKDGKWAVMETDLSELADGEIDLNIRTLDAFGNESVAVRRLIKATAPLAKAALPDTIADDNAINAFESRSLSICGIGADAETTTVQLAFSDATGLVIDAHATKGMDGQWAVEGVDISPLSDGELHLVVRSRNAYGNESVTERWLTKFTASPAKAAFPATIVEQHTVNANESNSFHVRGMAADPLATSVTLCVTDPDGNATEVESVKDSRGLWHAVGIDLSPLNDGELQLCAKSYDAYGNISLATRSVRKDTTSSPETSRPEIIRETTRTHEADGPIIKGAQTESSLHETGARG